MVLHEQITDGFAVVVLEAVAEVLALQGQSRQHGQPRDRVVAVMLGEGLDEVRCPVGGGPDFVAVEHQDLQRTEAESPLGQGVEHVVDVRVGGVAAEMIDHQPAGVGARAIEELPGVVADETKDAPIAIGHLPVQAPVRRQAVIKPQAFVRANGYGQNRDILEVFACFFGKWQDLGKLGRPLHLGLTPKQGFAGVYRRDPRSSRIPTARGDDAHFQPEPLRFVQCVVDRLERFRPEEFRACGNDFIRVGERAQVPDDRASHTLGLHFLQLAGDLLVIDMAIQPGPKRGWPRLDRRVAEFLLRELRMQ